MDKNSKAPGMISTINEQDLSGLDRDDKLLGIERRSTGGEVINYRVGNQAQRAHGSWYRGRQVNYMPNRENFFDDKDAVDKYLLYGWRPECPFISKKHGITAFGSCFAQHVSNVNVPRSAR